MKDMGEASFVLGVKIIRDRAKRLGFKSRDLYQKDVRALSHARQ